MNETLIPQRCIGNLRKSFFLMALLSLFTALFPIQKQLSYGASEYSSLTVLTSRQVTFFWQPLANLQTRTPYGYPLRTELDWESCVLELVIILSLSFLYFAWLERRQAPKASSKGEE
jgi:hypothetical protein